MAATELAPDAPLGEDERYRLIRLLGTGGMASVWLARDTRLDRLVAVKILSDVLCLDRGYVQRFEREARVAAGLSHPHLVNVFDYSVAGGRPFLIMEYVPGGTLADARGPTPDGGVALARDLLGALAHIHDAGIVHRDIKPANVLLDDRGRPRLADFGIAAPSGATRLTATGMVVGTARFIAPEVLAGQPASERSDLYACGVLLNECLGQGASPALARVVERLCAVDPTQRPASAEVALSMLERPPQSPGGREEGGPGRRLTPRAAGTRRPGLEVPRVTRQGRHLQVHLTRRALAVLAAVALAAAALVAFTVGGGHPPRGRSAPAPAGAPLAQQLDALERAVNRAVR